MFFSTSSLEANEDDIDNGVVVVAAYNPTANIPTAHGTNGLGVGGGSLLYNGGGSNGDFCSHESITNLAKSASAHETLTPNSMSVSVATGDIVTHHPDPTAMDPAS